MKTFLLFILLTSCAPIYWQGPITDHFDGKDFFNSNPKYKKKKFLDVIKWRFSSNKGSWPKNIESEKIEAFNEVPIGEIELTFIGHASVLIRTNNFNFLTDPVWAETIGPIPNILGPSRKSSLPLKLEHLPTIHAVFISHNHYDHLDLPTLKQLYALFKMPIYGALGIGQFLRNEGIDSAVDMDWWQTFALPKTSYSITSVPAQHWSKRSINDDMRTLWGGMILELEGKKIFYSGDSGFGPHFEKIKEKFAPIDICLLPIGAYKPSWFMKANHISPSEAVMVHKMMAAKFSLAVHYSTFNLGDDGYQDPLNDLKEALKLQNVEPRQFLALKPGEQVNFNSLQY